MLSSLAVPGFLAFDPPERGRGAGPRGRQGTSGAHLDRHHANDPGRSSRPAVAAPSRAAALASARPSLLAGAIAPPTSALPAALLGEVRLAPLEERVAHRVKALPQLVVDVAARRARPLPLLEEVLHRREGVIEVGRRRQLAGAHDQRLFGLAGRSAALLELGEVCVATVEEGPPRFFEALPQCFVLLASGGAGTFPLLHQLVHGFTGEPPLVRLGELLGPLDQPELVGLALGEQPLDPIDLVVSAAEQTVVVADRLGALDPVDEGLERLEVAGRILRAAQLLAERRKAVLDLLEAEEKVGDGLGSLGRRDPRDHAVFVEPAGADVDGAVVVDPAPFLARTKQLGEVGCAATWGGGRRLPAVLGLVEVEPRRTVLRSVVGVVSHRVKPGRGVSRVR